MPPDTLRHCSLGLGRSLFCVYARILSLLFETIHYRATLTTDCDATVNGNEGCRVYFHKSGPSYGMPNNTLQVMNLSEICALIFIRQVFSPAKVGTMKHIGNVAV
jgi:hypothetical protein